jgi:hypothetical protein
MWPQVVATLVGLWLMAAPAVLGFGEPASTVSHVIGPLAASASWIAVWSVTRGVRWLDLLFGAALLVAPLAFGYPTMAFVNSVIMGLALLALPFASSGAVSGYGGGWATLWPGRSVDPGPSRSEPEH